MSLERLEPQEKSLDWMYEGPSALVNREDYLLGRKVDKSFQLLEAAEKGNSAWLSEAEKDLTPVSILKPSGISGAIDVVRKIKNDPLYQIQKKEQEYRKQILQNPILLKKIQQQHGLLPPEDNSTSSKKCKKETKSKSKKHKKKHRSHSSDSSSSSSDEEVNQLLKTLKHSKDVSKLLEPRSGSSRGDDSKQKHSERRKRHDSESDEEVKRPNEVIHKHTRSPPRHRRRSRSRSRTPQNFRRHQDDRDREERQYRESDNSGRHHHASSSSYYEPTPRSYDRNADRYRQERPTSGSGRSDNNAKKKLNEEEMERRRQEMMGNAKQRDEERQKVVEKHRDELRKEHAELEKHRLTGKDATFINKQLSAAANNGSVEQRVKSNAYNIQRSKFAMDTNFARR